ncbi:hypothetical protein FQN55_009146 [Onygenales sp. PD_40]|nr:hypothetical protein FQN55_009146 [Onygenales sp. PD_40]KAK2774217.1 hypothetical protein FQN52_004401 [Onygenales sp. PD_12]
MVVASRAHPAAETATPVTSDSLSSRSSMVESPNSPNRLLVQSDTLPAVLPQNEKVIASSNGVTVSVFLGEPVLFLHGFKHSSDELSKTSFLRGTLRLKLTKSAKIKKIYLNFKGLGQTNWPEGVPPKGTEYHERINVINHTWALFNAQLPDAEISYGADHMELKIPKEVVKEVHQSKADIFLNSSPTSNRGSMSREFKRLSLQHNHSRSFGKGESLGGGAGVTQKGYKVFRPGEYLYNFELPIDSRFPETIKSDQGWVKYTLEGRIERAGAFRPNLFGCSEIPFIRAPHEGSLAHVEPIAISRTWENQLRYDVIISGKSFPIGGVVPIAFKLTPFTKVGCHRIQVFVTENSQRWTLGTRSHKSHTKTLLLFEKIAGRKSFSMYEGSQVKVTAGGGVPYDQRCQAASGNENFTTDSNTNLLGDLESDFEAGPTEMEFEVQLPTCKQLADAEPPHRLHFNTTFANLEITHWIKIVLRLSKPDDQDPTKRRNFDVSIDSPFHIMSCLATQSNLSLPSYSHPETVQLKKNLYCGCEQAKEDTITPPSTSSGTGDGSSAGFTPMGTPSNRRFTSGSSGLAFPPQAHIQDASNSDRIPRPMHLLRAPSFAPPSFEDLPPPPPLPTPPPDYETIVPDDDPHAGLEDYFERLHMAEREYDELRGSSRVDVPLTPGGRINRSMDIPREWVRAGETQAGAR